MSEQEILTAVDESGVITWWPGGKSHDAVASLINQGVLVAEDCSTSQETAYEVRRAKRNEGGDDDQ